MRLITEGAAIQRGFGRFHILRSGDRTGRLGRQDSNLRIRNCARLGLPLRGAARWSPQIVRRTPADACTFCLLCKAPQQ